MAVKSKPKSKQQQQGKAYISVPAALQISQQQQHQFVVSNHDLHPPNKKYNKSSSWRLLLFFFTLVVGIFNLAAFNHLDHPAFSQPPCLNFTTSLTTTTTTTKTHHHQSHHGDEEEEEDLLVVDNSKYQHHHSKSLLGILINSSTSLSDFWEQPDGLGYRPCIDEFRFSAEYRRDSPGIVQGRRKYLLVVVSGGINQQRNQIVDAVVIARILGASLVVPILQVNLIWGDESEFCDIFDLDHFKKVLSPNHVHIVSSLPSSHIRTKPAMENRTPLHASPQWIRARYLKRITREGVLLLRSLDSRLSPNLPPDLQKLRCKVAFEALRFAPPILQLGEKLAHRMRSKAPYYLALHLRMEKDVWVRTGCLPGLTKEYDEIVSNERKQRPELLTARSNMSYHERKLAGLCPLTALEVTRLLKALGAPKDARIYWAGGEPLGGKEAALAPLTTEFPNLYNKEDIALPGELEGFGQKKASVMAAIDYIVCEKSDVFMASHGGNMGHALQGQRAYAGHKKYITPNKRQMMITYFNNNHTEEEAELNRIIKELHRESLGQPYLIRSSKAAKDVTKYPVPECMCNTAASSSIHLG